tara:strand:- start:18 stop:371 length:354 start_codon:yes stop_codon:yes gene_type:complete
MTHEHQDSIDSKSALDRAVDSVAIPEFTKRALRVGYIGLVALIVFAVSIFYGFPLVQTCVETQGAMSCGDKEYIVEALAFFSGLLVLFALLALMSLLPQRLLWGWGKSFQLQREARK